MTVLASICQWRDVVIIIVKTRKSYNPDRFKLRFQKAIKMSVSEICVDLTRIKEAKDRATLIIKIRSLSTFFFIRKNKLFLKTKVEGNSLLYLQITPKLITFPQERSRN